MPTDWTDLTLAEMKDAMGQGLTPDEWKQAQKDTHKGKFLPTRRYGPHIRWRYAGKDLVRREKLNKATGEMRMVGGCSRCHEDILRDEPVVILAWANKVWSKQREREEVWYLPQYYHPDCYVDTMVEYYASHKAKGRKGVGGRPKIGFRKDRNRVFKKLYRRHNKVRAIEGDSDEANAERKRLWDEMREVIKEFKDIGGIPLIWQTRC